MAKKRLRAARGSGSIRKRTNGRWEARYTVGRDPGSGKQIQRSIYGATQKEVQKKLAQALASLDNSAQTVPNRLTVGQWLDIWISEYLGNVKPRTVGIYENDIRLHIKPALGAVRLDSLNTHTIQNFYNNLTKTQGNKPGLSPKTVKNIHGVFHSALNQAVLNGYIHANPSDACTLPRREKKELTPLNEQQITDFLKAIRGHPFEEVYIVTLFTGMREGEVLGLTWDCIDFHYGNITINKQMQLHQEKGMDAYILVSTKNSKSRTITAAPTVLEQLKRRRETQAIQQLQAGDLWENTGLVFTDEFGRHLTKPAVYWSFKRIVSSIGCPNVRFHDLRHSYAVAAIRSGIDIKTVQGNLGHATASFTLDVYGHVTERMKQDSADKIERFIQSISNA